MSDFARLEEKLAKLRQRERAPGEGRRLSGGDGAARLAALVTEIDETILPRRLTFGLGNKGDLHIAVASRKFQSVLEPAPEGLPEKLVGVPMSDGTAPEVAELGAALAEALGEAETVPISSGRQEKKFGSDVGIPAPQLARVWGAAPSAGGPVDASVLDRFVDGLGSDATAWLRIEGEAVTQTGGDPATVEALSELAAIFLDGYFGKFDAAFPEPSDACGTLVSPAPDGRASLFFVEIGDVSAVVLARPEKAIGLAARWQKLVAG